MPWVVLRGLAGTLLMALGGLLDSVVPHPSWVQRFGPLADLRADHGRVVLGVALAFAGLVLLTWAWWSLRGRVRGTAEEGVRTVRRVTAAWVVPLLLAPPLFSGDGWSYVATGYLTGHGFSPYVVGPGVLKGPISSAVNHKWLHTPSPYGPLPLAWGGAFSHVTGNPWVLLVLYRVLALVGLALLMWAVPRLAARCGRDTADASALVVASSFVIAHGIGGLHNDLLMAGLMLTALAATRRDLWWWGAALAGAAAAVKLPGGLVAIGVVLLSLPAGAGIAARVWRTVQVGVVACGVVVLAGIISGLGLGWMHALVVPTRERTLLAPTLEVAYRLHELLRHGGAMGHALVHVIEPMKTVWIVDTTALAAVGAWMLLRHRYDEPRAALGGVGVVLLGATLLSPVLHFWYFLWCVPLLGCLVLPRWARAALLALIVMLGLTAVDDTALHLHWLNFDATAALRALPPLAAAVAWWASRRTSADRIPEHQA